jgi:low affinity Fe/Cu permease
VTTSSEHRSPSEIDDERGWFDELAARAQDFVSRDVFFISLVILALLWVPSYYLHDSAEHWHLTLVIPVELITLFLVALMANHDRRSEQALHRKVDALATALAAVIEGPAGEDAKRHATELRAAVGLEDRESTDDA